MGFLKTWLEEHRWRKAVSTARRHRKTLGSDEQRRAFDWALRPPSTKRAPWVYPDAFYRLTDDDVTRACVAAGVQGAAESEHEH